MDNIISTYKQYNLLFDPVAHKYTDNFNSKYISTTQLIKTFSPTDDFDNIAEHCAAIGRNPMHPKYNKYKGKSKKDILAEWNNTAEEGCEIGNKVHDYLEGAFKTSTKFKHSTKSYSTELFTMYDVLTSNNTGDCDLEILKKELQVEYPTIYILVEGLLKRGYKVYAEPAVFNPSILISGQIDLFFIKGKEFIIVDWKSNKDTIKFEGGIWEKDNDGKAIRYKRNDDRMLDPISHLPVSTGVKYTLQLSIYDYLVECFGLTCKGNILCHIRRESYDKYDAPSENLIGKRKVELYNIDYLKADVIAMINHYNGNNNTTLDLN